MPIKFIEQFDHITPVEKHVAYLICDHSSPCVNHSLEEFSGSDLVDVIQKINSRSLQRAHDMHRFRVAARRAARISRYRVKVRDEYISDSVDLIHALVEQNIDLEQAKQEVERRHREHRREIKAFFERLLMVSEREYWGYNFPTLPTRYGQAKAPMFKTIRNNEEFLPEGLRQTLQKRSVRRWMMAFAASEFRGGWDRWCVPQCYLCGERLSDLYTEENIDDIVPTSKGGKMDFFNLALAHKACNYEKRDMDAHDYIVDKKWSKNKSNCSMCLKLLPRDEMVRCTPPKWYMDRFRVLLDTHFRFCADCYPRRGSKKLCVCEDPDHHVEPTSQVWDSNA